MHRGLAGGIGAADDIDSFAPASNGFRSAAAVVDASALKAFDAGNVKRAPLNAHREKQSVAGDFSAIGEFDKAVGAVDPETHDVLWRENFNAKTPGLRDGAESQVGARKSSWKSEIILNARTEPGLATGSFTLDHNRAQAF